MGGWERRPTLQKSCEPYEVIAKPEEFCYDIAIQTFALQAGMPAEVIRVFVCANFIFDPGGLK
jgi:hypothetical protein